MSDYEIDHSLSNNARQAFKLLPVVMSRQSADAGTDRVYQESTKNAENFHMVTNLNRQHYASKACGLGNH